MKYLVLVVVLVVAYMMWRNARLAERAARDAAPRPRPAADPLEMVSCPVCGLHLPQSEAVSGARGLMYCSHEHRQRAGG